MLSLSQSKPESLFYSEFIHWQLEWVCLHQTNLGLDSSMFVMMSQRKVPVWSPEAD
jgi:hypothetical protein